MDNPTKKNIAEKLESVAQLLDLDLKKTIHPISPLRKSCAEIDKLLAYVGKNKVQIFPDTTLNFLLKKTKMQITGLIKNLVEDAIPYHTGNKIVRSTSNIITLAIASEILEISPTSLPKTLPVHVQTKKSIHSLADLKKIQEIEVPILEAKEMLASVGDKYPLYQPKLNPDTRPRGLESEESLQRFIHDLGKIKTEFSTLKSKVPTSLKEGESFILFQSAILFGAKSFNRSSLKRSLLDYKMLGQQVLVRNAMILGIERGKRIRFDLSKVIKLLKERQNITYVDMCSDLPDHEGDVGQGSWTFTGSKLEYIWLLDGRIAKTLHHLIIEWINFPFAEFLPKQNYDTRLLQSRPAPIRDNKGNIIESPPTSEVFYPAQTKNPRFEALKQELQESFAQESIPLQTKLKSLHNQLTKLQGATQAWKEGNALKRRIADVSEKIVNFKRSSPITKPQYQLQLQDLLQEQEKLETSREEVEALQEVKQKIRQVEGEITALKSTLIEKIRQREKSVPTLGESSHVSN